MARTLEALETGLAAAFALDRRVLVEEFIQGTEVTGGVLGNARLQALPLVEIIPARQLRLFRLRSQVPARGLRGDLPGPPLTRN